MPTKVCYSNSKLIPAPRVSLNKVFEKSPDNQIIGSHFAITITGTILAYKGSPMSNGTFHTTSGYPADETVSDSQRLGAILRKQQAIRNLFSIEGQELEVQSSDGSAGLKCNPRIIGVNFQADQWYQTFQYEIALEADIIYLGGSVLGEDSFSNLITAADESWSFDSDEDKAETIGIPRTYKVSHSVSATGKRFYDGTGALVSPAWKQAQSYVLPKLGFDREIALSSGVNKLPDYYGSYNYVRNEQIGEQNGQYSVTETFILTSGTAIEDFNVSTKISIDGGYQTVSIEGTVAGLEARNTDFSVASFKYDNAVAKFSGVQNILLTRAMQYSSINTLNITPVNITIGRNPLTGIINYSYEYNDRPSNIITGAKSEVISVNDNWGEDVSADIFVLGRTLGPVIQNLGAHKVRMRNLSIELVMPVASGSVTNRFYTNKPSILATSKAQIQSIVDAVNPSTFGATKVNVETQNQSFDGSRYSLNVSWKFELDQNVII